MEASQRIKGSSRSQPSGRRADALSAGLDAAPSAAPIRLTVGPDFTMLTVDMGSPEACAVVAAQYVAKRRERALADPTIRLRSALDSYRKTQRNDRAGVRGFYANAEKARAEVRARLAELRAAALAFDAKEAGLAGQGSQVAA